VLWQYAVIAGFGKLQEQLEDDQACGQNFLNGSIGNMHVRFLSLLLCGSFEGPKIIGPVLVEFNIVQGIF
jgi:hypothetical protein